MNLSKNFTLEEMCLSEYAERFGLDNTPSGEAIENLELLCIHTLQSLRDLIDRPITVLSGYRSPAVNRGIGGSLGSQHIFGQAADIHVNGMPVDLLFHTIAKNIPFDQVINEFDRWVHVSYRRECRGQMFFARRVNGSTEYQPA